MREVRIWITARKKTRWTVDWDERAREEKVIQREKAHVEERERHYQLGRNLEAERAGDQQRARQQSGAGEDYGGRVQIAGARHGQVAADDQAP